VNRRAFFKALPGLPLPAAAPEAQARPLGILSLQTPLAGPQYHEGARRWTALNPGDILDLAREPSNPYDAKAVAVYRQADKLGYITRADNTVIANLMDQGARVKGRILTKNQSANPLERLGVEVVMKG